MTLDRCEGWVANNQIFEISKEDYKNIERHENTPCVADLVSFVESDDNVLMPIVLGSTVTNISLSKHRFEGSLTSGTQNKYCLTLFERALFMGRENAFRHRRGRICANGLQTKWPKPS